MKSKVLKEVLEWVKTAGIAIVVYLLVNIFVFTARVDGASMSPTLTNNDILIVNRLALKNSLPNYGDIVIFDIETKNYPLIKRVIGLPGDHIVIENGVVYRNETKLDETSYITCETSGEINTIVEDGYIFVLGDNRPDSADSRYAQVGQIKTENIRGKVICRVFPNPIVY